MSQPAIQFNKYPIGSLKQLFFLSVPISLSLMTSNLMSFYDRMLLSKISISSMEACVSANFLIQLFQLCLCLCASIAQVFVGQSIGEKNTAKVGSIIWQMIWFSIFSIIFIIPAGIFGERFFLKGLPVEKESIFYFQSILPFLFLFPLSTALSSFYLGQGKMRKVLVFNMLTCFFHLAVCYPLTLGIHGVFPRWGIRGTGISLVLSQLFLCSLLMADFLKRENQLKFNTRNYLFNSQLFWQQVKIGIPRLLGKIFIFSSWLGCVKIVTSKGGDFLLALSISASLNLLFSFINDSFGQAIITIASYLIGKGDQGNLKRLKRSCFLFLGLTTFLVSIPCVFFPKILLILFPLKEISLTQKEILIKCCRWLCLYFLAYGSAVIPFAFLTAFKDTLFKMVFDLFSYWICSFLPVYVFIGLFNYPPDSLYMISAISVFLSAVIYFLRLRLIQSKWRAYRSHLIMQSQLT